MTEPEPQPYRYGEMAWFYALLYTALAFGVELLLSGLLRLRVPLDNSIVVPVVITVPSLAAALLFRLRQSKAFLVLAILTALLTIAMTLVFSRLPGVNPGMAVSIVTRLAAGFLAFVVAKKIAPRSKPQL
jgi:hypothetical protein